MTGAGLEVRVEGLVKEWAGTRAVDGISFVADAGGFTVLLGPSGCGKSTTLRLIAGIEQATAGAIAIGGRDVTRRPPAQRDLAMVFQSYALFPHLSVAENIVFGLKVRKLPRAEREARLSRAAAMLGLAGLLDRKPSQLSGGQQQRVALGRAIVAEKPVCLMDEPLSNLDAKLRHEMRQEIRELQRNLGITMLYVTHDQTEAMTMADRIVLLRDGRIEQNASPEELYGRPETAFVARFIGMPPMNLLSPVGRSDNDPLVGVRPESIEFTGDGGTKVQVGAIEYLGSDSLVLCRAGTDDLTVRVAGLTRLAPGDVARIRWPDEAVHLFDRVSGRRRVDVAAAQPS